jgi:DNA-binding NarL/FixJ family response regulator
MMAGEETNPVHVAIVAAAPALRSGLRSLLMAEERIEILAEAASVAELGELDGLDVLLVAADELPTAVLQSNLNEGEPLALLLLSEQPEAARSLAGLPLRAWGLLSPESNEDELIAAVLALHEGLLAAAPALMRPLLGPAVSHAGDAELAEELTERELDVLQLLAEGLANKQIALQLNISEHTVKFHSSAIYAKLGVTNRTEAVRRGARLGLLVL